MAANIFVIDFHSHLILQSLFNFFLLLHVVLTFYLNITWLIIYYFM